MNIMNIPISLVLFTTTFNVSLYTTERLKKIFSNFLIILFFESFLFKNLLANIGDNVRATKEEITIENDNAIAVSLNNVPEIPSINIRGRKTAIKIKVVAIIANEICLDLYMQQLKEFLLPLFFYILHQS